MNRIAAFIYNSRSIVAAGILLLVLAFLLFFSKAYGDVLMLRSLRVSDNRVSQTASYALSFTIPASESLGSIKLEICSNDAIFGDPCTAPTGFDISSATLSSQTGETGFSLSTPNTNANTLVLTRPTATTSAGQVSYTLDHVINPSAPGTYYGRLRTFASTDATGPENDHGGLAFSMNDTLQVKATVPPYLLFCSGLTITGFDCGTAAGDYINFGSLTSGATSSADTQLLAATNGGSGYTIQVTGATMTSGNNVITAIPAPDVSRPGTSQFGLNLVANTTPLVGANPQGSGNGTPTTDYVQTNRFKFLPGDILASAATADEYKKYTVSYIVNIPNGQTPGVYVATLTYVCLANF